MINPNVLILGDCLEVMPDIKSASIDMVLCDLPYGTTAAPWDAVIDFADLWAQYARIIKPRGAIVLTSTQPFTSIMITSNLKWFKYSWIWEKERPTNVLNINKAPGRVHEDINVFAFPTTGIYNPQMTYRPEGKGKTKTTRQLAGLRNNGTETLGAAKFEYSEDYNPSLAHPRSVQYFPRDRTIGEGHPTQKPLALFEYLIRTYTNPGALVLDNTAGSGTTGEAAIRTGRQYILIESSVKYCKMAEKRLAKSQPPLFA